MDDISSKPNLYVFSINNKHTHSRSIVVIVVQPYDFSNKNRNLTETSVIERLKQNVNSHNKQIMETIWWYCDCFLLLNTIPNNIFSL